MILCVTALPMLYWAELIHSMGEGTLTLKPEEVPAWREGKNGRAGRQQS